MGATADTPGCGCEGDPRAMCTLLGLNHKNFLYPCIVHPLNDARDSVATNVVVPRSFARSARERIMVFKEGTFKGEQPEHFDGPHPAELETRVADALSVAGDIDASDVTVTCKGTRIVLSGSVGSAEEADRAVTVAASIKDVSDVENRLSWL